jgi:filamentous hemagglutinin family protein
MTPPKTVFRPDSVTKLANTLCVSILTILLSSTTLLSQELPQNGQIINGTGSIAHNGTDMSITQNSLDLDIDWNSFSIGAQNTVTFKQPSATSTALNRVTGTQTSAIHGKMTANGRVVLINPNGVMFGAGAQVNVGSLVTSTLGLSKSGSTYRFEGDSAAAIANAGQITTQDGGTIALIAAKITNTGSLTAPGGTVALGAGRRVRLDLGGPVALEVDEAAVDALISQGGAIRADGGLIYLGAKAAGDLAQTVINHSGTSQAQTLATGEDGRIFLMGDMRNDQIDVSGTLDASAPNGGFVETSAAQLMLRDGLRVTTKAHLGKTGTWLIDPTDIEIIAGDDDRTSDWSANKIKAGTINAALADSDVVITTAAADPASGTETGNITVNAGLTWRDTTLTLKAHDNIIINATIDATGGTGTGTGGLVLHYGQNGSDTSSYRVNAPIDLASTGSFKTKNGTEAEITHTIITALGNAGSKTGTDLQGMNGALGGNYVLGADIDASATSTSDWNDDKGFDPIGDYILEFTGTFDGLGHVIKNLTINEPLDENYPEPAGLFGAAVGATIQNVGLTNVNISGGISNDESTDVATGGLAGYIFNTYIKSSFVTGKVSGENFVGGLVGLAETSVIKNSYSKADVSGDLFVGGLIGYLEGNSGNLNNDLTGAFNSYYAGNVDTKQSDPFDLAIGVAAGENKFKTVFSWTKSDAHKQDMTEIQSYINPEGRPVAAWDNISADGNDDSVWRIYEGQSAPLLRVFMKKVNVTGQAVTREYDGTTDATISDLKFADADDVKGVTFASTGKGHYADANASEDKTVTFNIKYELADGETDLHTILQRYDFVEPELKGTINKKALTITANDASKIYGDTLTFKGTEFTADALQNGETISKVNLTSAGAAETANVKDYTITAAAATGSGFNADNYTITYANGELKVAKRDLTITANNASKIFGDTQTFDGTEFKADDLQNNETIGSVTLTSTGTDATADAGSYKITAKDATDGTFDAGNYSITYTDGTLTVVKQIVTPSGTVEKPENNSSVSTTPHAATHIRPETCVETFGLAPLLLNLPDLTEYCVDTSGGRPTQFTLVENSGIALPPASALLTLAVLRQ